MRRFRKTCLAAALLVATGSAAAHAQVGKNPSLQKPEPGAESQTPKLPPSDDNLSRKLDRSDGVIKPPGDVDPDMHVPPKDPGAGGSMPVIPPPSGNGPVQPK